METELSATHFFRNSDATSSRAVSAPKKAREPRYMRATGTNFMLAAMRRPWKERQGPSVSTPPAAGPGRGTEGGGGGRWPTQLALRLAQTLISPGRREAPAAFAPAGRVTAPEGRPLPRARLPPRDFLLDFWEFGWHSRKDWVSAVPMVCTAGPSVWDAIHREPYKMGCNPHPLHSSTPVLKSPSSPRPPPHSVSAQPAAPTC